jgi:SAM-dependent methyltransferase
VSGVGVRPRLLGRSARADQADGSLDGVLARQRRPLARLVARWRRHFAADLDDLTAPSEPDLPPDAATIRQWLWGPGFAIPGDGAHVEALLGRCKLAPDAAVLDASAGLGGPARALARGLQLRVIGLERDPDLARLGMALSRAEGLAKRATVRVYDPESFDLPPLHYDGVLCREATYAVRGKERFLRVLKQGLTPRGVLVMTDFVLDRTAGDRRRLGDWAPLASYPPFVWTLERYEDCFKSLGFELDYAADISAAYRAMVVEGWMRLAQRPELHAMPRRHFLPIIDEAERAMRTLRAIDDGLLRMLRLDAVAKRS